MAEIKPIEEIVKEPLRFGDVIKLNIANIHPLFIIGACIGRRPQHPSRILFSSIYSKEMHNYHASAYLDMDNFMCGVYPDSHPCPVGKANSYQILEHAQSQPKCTERKSEPPMCVCGHRMVPKGSAYNCEICGNTAGTS